MEFGGIELLALGNKNLVVEEVQSLEVGYNAVLGDRAFLTVSAYRNELRDFTTQLLPNVGTRLGRLNDDFGPYQPPAGLSPETAAIVLGTLESALPPSLFLSMSNDTDGSPIFALVFLAPSVARSRRGSK